MFAGTPSILSRLAAMAYELLLIAALLLTTFLLPHSVIAAFTHHIAVPLLLWMQIFLTLLIYFVWFWSHGRQTLPMKTWRIRLIAQNGDPLPFSRAMLRYLLCWPSLLLAGIGIFWALVDRDHQFLHDRLAGTRLVLSD